MAIMAAVAAALASTVASNVIGNALAPTQKVTPPVVPAQGGGGGRAENIFGQGQQTIKNRAAAPAPPDVSNLVDKNALTQALMSQNAQNLQQTAAGMTQPQAPKAGPSIGDILAATPEAIAAMAPLLGFMQGNRRDVINRSAVGAQGGGSGGQMVQGLNLPRRTTIGELLAALPRPRYNG